MKARAVALGGVLAALAGVIMLLGGVIPIATYVCPMLASFLLLVLKRELSLSGCIGWYGVVAFLSVLLCPDKEAAGMFVVLGYYPIIKPTLDRRSRPLRIFLKLLLFNGATALLYAAFIWVFQMEALVREAKELNLILGVLFLVMGNGTFLLFDLSLQRLDQLLRMRRKR